MIHERGRLIPFDLGYIDFDNPSQYREMWLGGGYKVVARRRASLTTEAFIVQAFGAHGGATYFQPFFLGNVTLAPRVLLESSYFAFVPLDDEGHGQHLLERVKVEYDFARFKVGAGYGAYQLRGRPWEHKPFVTGTLKVPLVGSFELWLQRLHDDHFTVQLRYAKVLVH